MKKQDISILDSAEELVRSYPDAIKSPQAALSWVRKYCGSDASKFGPVMRIVVELKQFVDLSKLEQVLASDPSTASAYAQFLGERFVAGEEIIAKDDVAIQAEKCRLKMNWSTTWEEGEAVRAQLKAMEEKDWAEDYFKCLRALENGFRDSAMEEKDFIHKVRVEKESPLYAAQVAYLQSWECRRNHPPGECGSRPPSLLRQLQNNPTAGVPLRLPGVYPEIPECSQSNPPVLVNGALATIVKNARATVLSSATADQNTAQEPDTFMRIFTALLWVCGVLTLAWILLYK